MIMPQAKCTDQNQISPNIRLDKWLWAARFFKTRELAQTAVNGGKVHVNDERAKPSRMVRTGETLCIRQGYDEKIIIVTGLSDKRGSATQAATLYRETDGSIAARQEAAETRKALGWTAPSSRPNKKQRRQIIRFKQQ